MRERLWFDAVLPMQDKEPTRWFADEDLFKHTYPSIKANYFSVIAKCLSAQWEHEFVLWTLNPQSRDEVLAIAQTEYKALCQGQGHVVLFDFPFPNVTYPDWSARPVLPPTMNQARDEWLKSACLGDVVCLHVYDSTQARCHQFSAKLEAVDEHSFSVGKAGLPLPRQAGYHRFTEGDRTFEYWITPLVAEASLTQLGWSEGSTVLPFNVPAMSSVI